MSMKVTVEETEGSLVVTTEGEGVFVWVEEKGSNLQALTPVTPNTTVHIPDPGIKEISVHIFR
jgi:hypothetical protein